MVFNVNGGGSTGGDTTPPPTTTRTITLTLSSTTGEPGDEVDVTVSASPNDVVVIDSGDLDDADFSRLFGTTPFDTVISLPDEEGEYDFSATSPGYTSDSATVTVESELANFRLRQSVPRQPARKPLALPLLMQMATEQVLLSLRD